MVFRAMDAGCGGVEGDNPDVGCDQPVTAVGLYLASTTTVWPAFACTTHAHHLIAPRALRARDHDTLRRRQQRVRDQRVGRRYAGEQDGPLARGTAATTLVNDATAWARRNPFPSTPATNRQPTQPGLARRVPDRLTVDQLADELGVHPGDVRVLLSWLDPDHGGLHPDGTLLNDYAGTIRDQLDHLCERTVPDYWWPGNDPDAGTGATKMR